jgi:hypothetical protein
MWRPLRYGSCMRPVPRWFVAICWTLAVLFSLSVGLQVNDPDPIRWMALYAAAGIAVGVLPARRFVSLVCIAIGLVAAGWAAYLGQQVFSVIKISDLWLKMSEKDRRGRPHRLRCVSLDPRLIELCAAGPARTKLNSSRLIRSACADHLEMRDAVLVVDIARARKAKLGVELFEVGLRADPDRTRAGRRDAALHQLPTQAAAAEVRRRDHATDAELGKLHTRRDDAQVRRDRVAALRPDVARHRIDTVGVLIHALLLDDEHALAQLHDRVQLADSQLRECAHVPDQVHGLP